MHSLYNLNIPFSIHGRFHVYVTLLFLLLISSCKPNDDFPDGTEFQTSVDCSIAWGEFAAIRTLVEMEAMDDTAIWKGGSGKVSAAFCQSATADVTVTGVNQATLILDFGNGCSCLDGRTRSGKLICEFNGRWRQSGSTLQIAPEDYTMNSIPVVFSLSATNLGLDPESKPHWDVQVASATFHTSGGTISWGSSAVVSWTAGDNTPGIFTDDEYSLAGTASGKTRMQLAFDAQIAEKLVWTSNCGNMIRGRLEINPENLQLRTLDYGEGTCDNLATLWIGDWSAPLSLF